jgi:hypothetical protein
MSRPVLAVKIMTFSLSCDICVAQPNSAVLKHEIVGSWGLVDRGENNIFSPSLLSLVLRHAVLLSTMDMTIKESLFFFGQWLQFELLPDFISLVQGKAKQKAGGTSWQP